MIDPALPILVVDDYQTMVRIMRNLLKQIGFEDIDEASNGEAALEKLEARRYGLIISDWNMEPMTGIELLRRVRAAEDATRANTPFIMVTAEGKGDNVTAAKRAGVDSYLIKPFNAQTLRARIEALRAA